MGLDAQFMRRSFLIHPFFRVIREAEPKAAMQSANTPDIFVVPPGQRIVSHANP